ncbi:MAG: response regulator [Anaerolineae bacterium]|jgi:two-component system, NtrC family, sensor kinase
MANETILIVDDRRENIVHLANNVLKPEGYEIITAMDGQRGLKRILKDKPDLVILDMNMPKMDGLEVLSALQDQGLRVPVILTTFYGSEQVARQALRLGAVDYVVKPYDTEDMLQAIRRALAQRTRQPVPAKAEAEDTTEKAMPLTRQVERWMRDMNILTRVGKALVAQLDLDLVCARTVEAAIYVTRSDCAFLYLAQEGQPGLRLRAGRGPQDPRARILNRQIDSGLALEVAHSGEPALRTKAPADVALFETVGTSLGPIVAAPLRWHAATIGVLVAARNSGEATFAETDAEWLSGLADYAAIAVHNARVHLRQKQDLAAAETAASQARGMPAAGLAPEELAGELERVAGQLQSAAGALRDLGRRLTQGGGEG